jgi:SOS-response transcriptional repressor LexA/5-methylcytosine-specific restriction endonuclease McrA
MPQKRGLEINKRLTFRTPLWNFIQAYGPGNMNAAFADFKSAKVPIPLRGQLDVAINSIAATIVDGPVTFSGGLKQPHFHFTGPKTAKGKCRDPRSTCDRLGYVRVPVAMWRELCLIGQWIGESLILRWAELTHDISNGRISIADAVARLLIQPEPDRDAQFARSIYSGQTDLTCVWTQEPLRKDWHVDHAVPFSVWHNNDLWNLFPCSQRANSQKSDKLVTVGLLQKSRKRIIQSWELLHSHAEERFSIEISRSLLHDSGMSNWQSRAFNGFVESLELVAVQRGADRWDGPRETHKKSAVISVPAISHPVLLNFEEVESDAFKTALPYIGALAAGKLTNGFLLGRLSECRNAQWLRVPPALAGPKRFIVEVAGDSMEPTFRRGEWLIFEYHRTPRENNQVVIVNATEIPDDIPEVAIKRIRQTPEDWLVISDNPKFKTVSVSKEQCRYPILGVFVAKIK